MLWLLHCDSALNERITSFFIYNNVVSAQCRIFTLHREELFYFVVGLLEVQNGIDCVLSMMGLL